MTKTVFDNNMLAHVWAQRRQAHGRTSNGNFYFDAGTLYSYGSHFIVAKFVANSKGETAAVLFNRRSYSVSTSRHQSLARRAVHGLGLATFHVDNCDPRTEADHLANFKELLARRDGAATARDRARSQWRKDSLQREAVSLDAEATNYAAFFLKGNPGAIAKRLKRESDKAAKERAQREVEAKSQMDAAKIEAAPVAEKLRNMWRSFASYREISEVATAYAGNPYVLKSIALRELYSAFTMMRVNGAEVETSRGATFPVTHAVRVFPILAKIRERGEDWTPTETIRLGHFQIDGMKANGDVIAGCHTVPWSEVERCAELLGLLENA